MADGKVQVSDPLNQLHSLARRHIRDRVWRRRVSGYTGRLIRIAGLATLVSTIVTFVLTGFDFFTVTIPNAGAALSRTALLGPILRPVLVDLVLKEDLGYGSQCVGNTDVIDLDGDGSSTDLLLTIYPRAANGGCADEGDSARSAIETHLILKDQDWHDWRPRYAQLLAFAPGIPARLSTRGSFIVASTAARLNPAFRVYAYSNGALLSFGRYQSPGGDAPKTFQLGRQMFMRTMDGFVNVEVTLSGEARTIVMTRDDIIARNNTAIVIEDWKRLPKAQQNARLELPADPPCAGRKVSVSGERLLEFNQTCTATLEIAPIEQIVTNVSCDGDGVRLAPQFPWGWMIDATAAKHVLKCDGNGRDYGFEIEVRKQQQ